MESLKAISDDMKKLDIARANQSQYKITVKGLEENELTVLDFKSEDYRISCDYNLKIHVKSRNVINPADAILKHATLEMMWEAEPVYIHGKISAIQHIGTRTDNTEEYILTTNSSLHHMKHTTQNRIFLNADIKKIITDVLSTSGMLGADYELNLNESYQNNEYIVQYDETDYAFLQRMIAYYGIFFIFKQDSIQSKVIFYDNIDNLPIVAGGGKLLFQVQSGETRSVESVFALRLHARLKTESVRVKDYNYRTPESSLEAATNRNHAISGHGNTYIYGNNYKTLDAGARRAKIMQQALDWQREIYFADTDCRGLTPGYKFTLSEHNNDSLNGDYRVICVEHHADQNQAQSVATGGIRMTYRNTVTLIRAGVPYRTDLPTKKYVNGVFSAKVESTGGDYAYIDEQGRYRIRLPFDLSSAEEGEASHPVRLMQPYSGQGYGMHFPLHAGTEVAVTCVNGDIDRPLMLGAISNPDTPNVVTSKNNSQNILRTWGGNELLMEDRKGEEKTEIFTRGKKNILTLDANEKGHKIRLATEEGEMEQYAAKTMLIESGDSQTVQSGNDHLVTVENSQHLMTKNKEIEQKSATDIKMKAGDNILLHAETKNIEMTSGKDMLIDVNNSMSIEVRNNNLEVLVSNGNIGIKAAKEITVKGQGGGVIHVGQSGGSIEISTAGDLTITGKSVTINGNSINIKGNSVGNN